MIGVLVSIDFITEKLSRLVWTSPNPEHGEATAYELPGNRHSL